MGTEDEFGTAGWYRIGLRGFSGVVGSHREILSKGRRSGRIRSETSVDFMLGSSMILSHQKMASVRRWVKAGVGFLGVALVLLFGFCAPAIALDYNRESLIKADFSGQVLTDSEFTKANMRGSNLSHADLRGVQMFGTNLEGANLEGANLSFATLDSARMVDANLKDAVLEGAFAASTKFNRANIEGADFTDVLMRQDMHDILCEVATGTNPTTGRETRETLECD
jgi:Pentapeptide repeats (8 copies)